MTRRVRAALVSEVPEQTGLELTLDGRIVALFRVEDQFFALDGICPHAGGPLGKGMLRDGIVTCPWHGWQFDVRTGTHCLTPTICQTVYPVDVEGEEIFVIFPEE